MRMASILSRLARGRLAALVPLALVGGMLLPVVAAPAAHASGVPYSVGDVFAATGDGKIEHFSSTGVLLDTLDGGTGGTDTGMAFDPAGDLYSTQFDANTVVKFDDQGDLLGTFGGAYNAHPETMVRDNAGDFYVGQADGSHQVLKFNASGTLLASFSPAVQDRGTDFIDLAADQCTLFYTSGGNLIKRFNVCTNTQLPDFVTLPVPVSYGLRILANQDVLVAGLSSTASAIFLLSPTGALLRTYTLPDASTTALFPVALDPDQSAFWTGDGIGGKVYEVDIASGSILASFDTDPTAGQGLNGLAVYGDLPAAQAKLALAPASSTRQVYQTVTLTAQLTNVVNPAGTEVVFTVTGANPQTDYGTADAGGTVTFTYTGGNAGTDTVVASANPAEPPGPVTSIPATVTWTRIPTTLTYTGAATSAFHDPATLSAQLTDAYSNPVPGRQVTFTLDAQSCSAATDASGSASCSITPDEPAGTYTVTAAFAEDNQYLASSDSTPFTVTHKETLLDYTGDTHIANAIPAHLAGTLSEDGNGTPIAGRNVTFTLGSGASAQSCTGTTDASGVAGCTIASVSQPLNAAATVPVTAVFSGDPYYQPSTATATLSLQFLTGRAYGVSADVSLLLANLNLPPQPDTGEVRTATPTSTTTPCTTSLSTLLISADSLCPNVTVTLAPGTSTATSTLQGVTIGIPGLPVITATAIQSDSTSTCTAATGSVTITNLTVGGVAVNTDVGPNTVINLGGLAKLTLNEQLSVPGADQGLTVNALHLLAAGGTVNVVIGSATSDAHNC